VKLTANLYLVPRSRMRGDIASLPNTPTWHGAHLKHKENFTFSLCVYCMKETYRGHLPHELSLISSRSHAQIGTHVTFPHNMKEAVILIIESYINSSECDLAFIAVNNVQHS
jgi:hypothetical protein